MSVIWPVFVCAAAIAAAVLSAIYSSKKAKQRFAELTAFAANSQFLFIEQNNALTDRWQGEPFGHQRATASEVFQGRIGAAQLPFTAFTYTYKVRKSRSGKKKTRTYHFAVYVLHMSRALPYLSVTPEDGLTRFANFGRLVQDIEFESDDFNRAFQIQGDPRFAYGVIDPQMMEWLLGPGRWLAPWRFDNFDLICFESGKIDPARFPNKLLAMTNLVEHVPQLVWDEYGR